MEDGRGKHQIKKKEVNIKKVKDWLKSNPEGFIKDCCNETDLSYLTVRKHIDYLEDCSK